MTIIDILLYQTNKEEPELENHCPIITCAA